jgi:hypothetical protein
LLLPVLLVWLLCFCVALHCSRTETFNSQGVPLNENVGGRPLR